MKLSPTMRNLCRHPCFALALFVILSALLIGAGVRRLNDPGQRFESAKERYYQAVYVLQNFGGPAADEREDIPRSVFFNDATESLLHHPDKIFILRTVADALAKLRHEVPKARLFEAYARLALGERRQGTDLLSRYVAEYPYDSRHYSLLCANLFELRDYAYLYVICREWREHDAQCREDRGRYIWISLYHLGRYAEAKEYALLSTGCIGWQSVVYAAKAALASSGKEEATRILDAAVLEHGDEAALIRRMWDHIKDKDTL